jgi:hypothetical protein
MQTRLIFSAIFFLNAVAVTAQSISYEHVDKIYRVLLPDWEKLKEDKKIGFLQLKASTTEVDESLSPVIQLETVALAGGDSRITLAEYAKRETATIQPGEQSIKVVSTRLQKINNKEWWELEISANFSKKNIFKEYTLQTLHNGIIYTMRFAGFEKYYDQHKSEVIRHLRSFMFYTSDNTVYNNTLSPNLSLIASKIPLYAGAYIRSEGEENTTLSIIDLKSGKYRATAESVLSRDGKKFAFNSTLIIDSIDENQIVLSDDAVSFASQEIGWAKGTYRLRRTTTSLTGVSYSSANAFPESAVNFKKQQTELLSAKSPVEARKPTILSSSPGAKAAQTGNIDIDTTHKPYKYFYFTDDYEMDGTLALFGKIPTGTSVSVLDFNGGKTITVKTTVQKKETSDCTGLYTFTRVANPPSILSSSYYRDHLEQFMKDGNRGMIAMLHDKTLPFNVLETVAIQDKSLLQTLHDRTIKSNVFKKFAGGVGSASLDSAYSNGIRRTIPNVTQLSVNGMIVYLIEYNVGITPRFIEINGQIFILNEGTDANPSLKATFYKLGNNYFIHVGSGKSDAQNIIYEIRPNGIKKECFFKAEC